MSPRERLRSLWRDLNTSSDFMGNPYGGLTNQISHSAVAAFVFLYVCCVWFMFAGEMPSRWAVVWGIVVVYFAAIEWRAQGWRGRDSLIDAGFVAITPLTIAVAAEEVSVNGWVSVVHIHIGHLLIALTSLALAWLVYAISRARV